MNRHKVYRRDVWYICMKHDFLMFMVSLLLRWVSWRHMISGQYFVISSNNSEYMTLDPLVFHWIILLYMIWFWDLWDFLFWLLLVCCVLFSIFISSNSLNLFEVVIGAVWVILLIDFCFLKAVSFVFSIMSLLISDRWSLSLFICWFGP